MDNLSTKYPQAQLERLAFIDLRLRFLGEIRRQDLISRFGIQAAAATRDLALYRELSPKNLEYDTKSKVYRYGEWFWPLFSFTSERVLIWLTKGYGDGYPGHAKSLVSVDSSITVNSINLDVLAVITRAIHQQKIVELSYRSLTNGQSMRQFIPFALVDNGFRWQVRGYDRKQNEFLDLILSRIADAKIVDEPVREKELPVNDIQWNRIVELELVPHPANVQHPDTIEADYGMVNGVLQLCLRAAQVGYLLQCWHVDCSAEHRLRGPEFQLWLRNREALYGVANLNLSPGY